MAIASVFLSFIMALAPAPAQDASAPADATTMPDTFDALKSRAEAGDTGAQYAIGRAYMDGRYLSRQFTRDVEVARTWFARASDGRHGEAAYDLGMTYYPAEVADAEPWFLKAAGNNLPRAYHRLCEIYRATDLKNWDKALTWCAKSAEHGEYKQYLSMTRAVEGGLEDQTASPSRALAMYTELADWRSPEATMLLANKYYAAGSDPRTDAKALHFTRLAIGVASTYISRLAEFYETGRGVPMDIEEAGRLKWHSAQLGSATARTWLTDHPETTQASLDAREFAQSELAGKEISFQIRHKQLAERNFYPARAEADEIEGSAILECRIALSGDIENCTSSQASPKGYGFAEATMRKAIQLDLHTADPTLLKPYAGKLVRIRFNWDLH